MKSVQTWLPLLVLASILLLISLAPAVAPYDPLNARPEIQLTPPGPSHPLGTDYLGRDVWSRLLYGGRHTLITAGSALGLAGFVGYGVGMMAGMMPKTVDSIIMALVNAALAFPPLILALVILTALERTSISLILALGIAQTPAFVLYSRSVGRHATALPYMLAAEALGAGTWHRFRYHLLPAVMPLLINYAVIGFSYTILNGAALSYLGFLAPDVPDWGLMLAESRLVMRIAPWTALAPGVAITLVVVLVNVLANRVGRLPGRMVSYPGS